MEIKEKIAKLDSLADKAAGISEAKKTKVPRIAKSGSGKTPAGKKTAKASSESQGSKRAAQPNRAKTSERQNNTPVRKAKTTAQDKSVNQQISADTQAASDSKVKAAKRSSGKKLKVIPLGGLDEIGRGGKSVLSTPATALSARSSAG